MTTITFETGATSAQANNLVLSVINDCAYYENLKHAGFAYIEGSSHSVSFKDIVTLEANKQRKTGSKFRPQHITEATKLVREYFIDHCLELIRDDYNNSKHVSITYRRWFDSLNGNSYWSAKIATHKYTIAVPFSYGYGSQPEHDTIAILKKLGFDIERENATFYDQGYTSKQMMFNGNHLA